MLRRCNWWDYCAPRIYMVTLTLADRTKPLLGRLVIDSPYENTPDNIRAYIEPSPLGLQVQQCWDAISKLHPQIRLLGLQLMEEHLHGILYVTERLSRPLGNVIGGFKGGCTKAYRELTGLNNALFSPGFQDTILSGRNQLDRMIKYLQDNPRRAAIKRLYPEYFRQIRCIPFDNGAFTGIGNSFLLEQPSFYQVQVSRSASSAEIDRKASEMMQASNAGAVIVSSCISPGEKQLSRLALNNARSLIVLHSKGFSPLYKPPGQYFTACANGRLLMLAPSQWPYIPGKKPLMRWEACVLNSLAQKICGANAKEIRYCGFVPDNIDELVARAMGNNQRLSD